MIQMHRPVLVSNPAAWERALCATVCAALSNAQLLPNDPITKPRSRATELGGFET